MFYVVLIGNFTVGNVYSTRACVVHLWVSHHFGPSKCLKNKLGLVNGGRNSTRAVDNRSHMTPLYTRRPTVRSHHTQDHIRLQSDPLDILFLSSYFSFFKHRRLLPQLLMYVHLWTQIFCRARFQNSPQEHDSWQNFLMVELKRKIIFYYLFLFIDNNNIENKKKMTFYNYYILVIINVSFILLSPLCVTPQNMKVINKPITSQLWTSNVMW